tara:strand:- start:444 stop:692 length:249 start_codon:yes stop_codon:yes gene_type:complete
LEKILRKVGHVFSDNHLCFFLFTPRCVIFHPHRDAVSGIDVPLHFLVAAEYAILPDPVGIFAPAPGWFGLVWFGLVYFGLVL